MDIPLWTAICDRLEAESEGDTPIVDAMRAVLAQAQQRQQRQGNVRVSAAGAVAGPPAIAGAATHQNPPASQALSDAQLRARIISAEQQMQRLAAVLAHRHIPHNPVPSHYGADGNTEPLPQELQENLPQLHHLRAQQDRQLQEHNEAIAAMQADSAGFLDACHQNSVQMVEDAADFKLAMLRHQEQIAAQLGVQTLVMTQMKQEQQRTSQQLVALRAELQQVAQLFQARAPAPEASAPGVTADDAADSEQPFKAGQKASAAAAAPNTDATLAQIKQQEPAASTAEAEGARNLRSSAEKRRRLAAPKAVND